MFPVAAIMYFGWAYGKKTFGESGIGRSGSEVPDLGSR